MRDLGRDGAAALVTAGAVGLAVGAAKFASWCVVVSSSRRLVSSRLVRDAHVCIHSSLLRD
jgi:hypothetical protein